MSYVKTLELLDKTDISYQEVYLVPIGTERYCRQLGSYLSSLLFKIEGEMPILKKDILRSFKDRLFSVSGTTTLKTSYGIQGKKYMVYVPSDKCRIPDKDYLLVPIGNLEKLNELHDILDHLLWANTHNTGNDFYLALENLLKATKDVLDCIKDSSKKVPVWIAA